MIVVQASLAPGGGPTELHATHPVTPAVWEVGVVALGVEAAHGHVPAHEHVPTLDARILQVPGKKKKSGGIDRCPGSNYIS